MGIVFTQKGDFSKFNRYTERVLDAINLSDLDKYGRRGVKALRDATPIDTGKTAESWYYTTERKDGVVSLSFHNGNENQGVQIAIILQYGHGTGGGGYVVGVDYINPALKPVFDEILDDCWKEVMMA